MKGMIFAAGLGTRLKPWTDNHPKALVEINGTPILGLVIKRMIDSGITRIVINVHHFAEQIEDYLLQNNNFGIDISLSDERDQLLDTGGGIVKAAPLLQGTEPILIHNADVMSDFDIQEMVRAHVSSGSSATLLCSNRTSTRMLYFDGANRLCGWENKNTGETRPYGFRPGQTTRPLAFGGVHIISPKILCDIVEFGRDRGAFSIIPFYISASSSTKIVSFEPKSPCRWFDVGRPASLELARTSFSES